MYVSIECYVSEILKHYQDAEVVVITEGDFKTFIRFIDTTTARLFVSQVTGVRTSLLGSALADEIQANPDA